MDSLLCSTFACAFSGMAFIMRHMTSVGVKMWVSSRQKLRRLAKQSNNVQITTSMYPPWYTRHLVLLCISCFCFDTARASLFIAPDIFLFAMVGHLSACSKLSTSNTVVFLGRALHRAVLRDCVTMMCDFTCITGYKLYCTSCARDKPATDEVQVFACFDSKQIACDGEELMSSGLKVGAISKLLLWVLLLMLAYKMTRCHLEQ